MNPIDNTSYYDKFNKDFEELRVKVSHPKAMSILRNIKKTEKKNFIENAILNFYGDIRNGKVYSNSINLDVIEKVENEEPTPLSSNHGSNQEVITQLMSILASGIRLNEVSPLTMNYNQETTQNEKTDLIDETEETECNDGDDIPF